MVRSFCERQRHQYRMMKSLQVPIEYLTIKFTLVKNPNEYQQNRLQRLVGSELQDSIG